MEYILVSACLLGEPVRYDGSDKRFRHEVLQRWLDEGRVLSVCPEVAGGLPVPRMPAEISDGAGGAKVLIGEARVVGADGKDFSAQFVSGAQRILALARAKNIKVAVLKEGSPSCGSELTYDGTFSSCKVSKPGVTTVMLQVAGIHVFGEDRLADADFLLRRFEVQ